MSNVCSRARARSIHSTAIKAEIWQQNNGDDNNSDDNDEIVRCLAIDSVKQFSNKIIKTNLQQNGDPMLRWPMFERECSSRYALVQALRIGYTAAEIAASVCSESDLMQLLMIYTINNKRPTTITHRDSLLHYECILRTRERARSTEI